MIAGRYTRDREIGRGGMGAVWLGRDEVLGRPVAVKSVGIAPGTTMPDIARAEREAKIAASLNHPHIVGVYDLVIEDGQQWLVMEYVEGSTLSELVQARGPLPVEDAAAILAQAASALAAAHAGGVVHRDVKPSNILVREDGHVKLTDFGIARSTADAALTQTGLVTGSPAYLAPEVASGQQATPASDAWSLGATLFHALAGHPPYDATDNVLGALYRIVHEPPPQLEHAGRLAPLLAATMTRTPDERWTMAEIRSFLDAGSPDDLGAGSFPGVQQDRPEDDPGPTEALHVVPGMAASDPGPSAGAAAPPDPPTAGPPAAVPPRAGGGRRTPDRRRRAVLPAAIAVLVAVLVVAIALLALQGGPEEDVAQDPTTDPSATPSSPADPEPEETDEPEEPAVPTGREMRTFVDAYLTSASSDPAQAFQLLTPPFQQQSGQLEGYEGFWGRVSNPRLESFSADPAALTVSYTYRYQLRGAGQQVDEVRLQLVKTEDGFLISGEV